MVLQNPWKNKFEQTLPLNVEITDEMKQQNFNLPHHCQSIRCQNNGKFACNPVIVPPRTMTRCDGTCFQRNFYPLIQQQYPSYICHPILPTTVPPWSVMPLTCNPSFNHPFHETSHFEKIQTKRKPLDPSSYRVTVRRITPLHVAAPEAYRTDRNKDADRIHLQPFKYIITSPDQKFRTTPTTKIYGRDDPNSDNQNIPSIPSKKIVSKNKDLQVSSTSFITATDNHIIISDNISEKSSEYHIIPAQILNELSLSTTEVKKSNTDSSILSELNSTRPTIDINNPMTTNINEDITTNKNVKNISDEIQITKQTELSTLEEHLFVKPQPTIDKVESYKKHSIKQEFHPLEFSHHYIPNTITPESTIDPASIDNSYPLTLPSSLPPNIDTIKSNEMLITSSRSITSLTKKSSIDIKQSTLPLRTARSTLDFGLLIHDTTT